jgi:hypothetical protein
VKLKTSLQPTSAEPTLHVGTVPNKHAKCQHRSCANKAVLSSATPEPQQTATHACMFTATTCQRLQQVLTAAGRQTIALHPVAVVAMVSHL